MSSATESDLGFSSRSGIIIKLHPESASVADFEVDDVSVVLKMEHVLEALRVKVELSSRPASEWVQTIGRKLVPAQDVSGRPSFRLSHISSHDERWAGRVVTPILLEYAIRVGADFKNDVAVLVNNVSATSPVNTHSPAGEVGVFLG